MTSYLYLDTETGGVDPSQDALLTIGLVAHNDERGVLDTAHILVQPEGLRVAPEALKINHIDLDEHCRVALSRRDAAMSMVKFIHKNFGRAFNQKPLVIGHNIGFDRSFVDQLWEDRRELPYSYRNLDTMGISLFLMDCGIMPKLTNIKLDTLLDFFKVEISEEDRHTALGDALVTRDVHLAMRELARAGANG